MDFESARTRAQRNATLFRTPYWAVRFRIGCYEFVKVTMRPERFDRLVQSEAFFPQVAR